MLHWALFDCAAVGLRGLSLPPVRSISSPLLGATFFDYSLVVTHSLLLLEESAKKSDKKSLSLTKFVWDITPACRNFLSQFLIPISLSKKYYWFNSLKFVCDTPPAWRRARHNAWDGLPYCQRTLAGWEIFAPVYVYLPVTRRGIIIIALTINSCAKVWTKSETAKFSSDYFSLNNLKPRLHRTFGGISCLFRRYQGATSARLAFYLTQKVH